MRFTTGSRWPARLLLLLVPALAGVIAVAPTASAGETYAIKTATIPSGGNGAPEPGGGARLTNKPYGYYIGRAVVDSSFTSMGTTNNHHWGRAWDTVNMCAWVYLDALGADRGYGDNNCSSGTQEQISHRMTIGHDFNYEAHVGNQPTPVAVYNPNCTFWFNYFYGTDFSSNGGHWAHPVGPIGSSIEYRFTTRDNGAYVVRHPVWGWGFVQAGCTARSPELHNDND